MNDHMPRGSSAINDVYRRARERRKKEAVQADSESDEDGDGCRESEKEKQCRAKKIPNHARGGGALRAPRNMRSIKVKLSLARA